MKRSFWPSDPLQNGGFAFHHLLGRWVSPNFVVQCCLLAAIAAASLLAAAALDGTFFLPGRDVGLLEHPAIWAFIALQVALPISIRSSLEKVSSLGAVGELSVPDEDFKKTVVQGISRALQLRDVTSILIAAALYTIGFSAFAWNSYQNQLPGILLPYDFWDSSLHPVGFWVTRIYKFYLFVWLLPYIALVHSAVLIVTLRVIRERRLAGTLELQPFHPDGAGGLGFVPGLVTNPIIAALLVSAIPVAAAFEVHRSIDVTPLMGASIVIAGGLIAYAIPVLRLRADIIAMKRTTVEKLRLLQQDYYSRVIGGKRVELEVLKQGNEALDYFEKICTRVNAISNYPHLARLLKYIGLALTPSIVSLALKLYETFNPVLMPLLKRT